MMLDWNQYREQLLKTIGDLGQLSSQTVRGYRELSDAGTKTARLDAKRRELIALAVGVTRQCDGCITTHVQAARKQGATAEEIVTATHPIRHAGSFRPGADDAGRFSACRSNWHFRRDALSRFRAAGALQARNANFILKYNGCAEQLGMSLYCSELTATKLGLRVAVVGGGETYDE